MCHRCDWWVIVALAASIGLAAEPSAVDMAGRPHPPLYTPDQPLGDIGHWYVLDVIETRSSGGATLTKLDDGSVLVTGHNADHDTYTVTVRTTLRKITALRLDALAEDSLPSNGPGRPRNGNFTLTQWSVTAAPADQPHGARPLRLTRATSDYSQRDYDAALAIDGDPATGWSIGNGGADHYLVAELDTPTDVAEATLLTFTLAHEHADRKQYNLGRFRLSATTRRPPPPAADEPQFQPLLVTVGFAPVPIAAFSSTSGATMTPHPSGDGSILVSGGQPLHDTYTLELRSELEQITGLRLEAIPDRSLPQGGPGRSSPTFAVSEVVVHAAAVQDPQSRRRIGLQQPSATDAQRNLPVERAIDGNEKTFWAVHARPPATIDERSPCAAAFVFESPIGFEGGTVLTVELQQRLAIGRLRLSLSTAQERHHLTLEPRDAPGPRKNEPPEPPKRIERYYNVGGPLYADPRGRQWLPTRRWRKGFDGYVGGLTYSSDLPLNPLLQRSLTGIDAFRVHLPAGRYRVALLFAEPRDTTTAGYRRFDVHMEGVKVLNDLDPVRVTGAPGVPFVHVEPSVPVKDGVLDIEFFGDRPVLCAVAIIGLQ